MANPQWPSTLPQNPFGNGAPKYEPAQNVQRTQMEAGPPKQRRRFTAVPEAAYFTLILDEDEVETLRDFIANTIKDALPFDWKDFRDDSACSYRLPKGRASVTYEHLGDDLWTVNLELEKLP